MSISSTKMVMKYNVITEGLSRHGKRIQSIPAGERRRIAIEKAKSSTEIVIASYVLSKHIVIKELKTESTGSVYGTEEYADYNSFLNTLLRLIYDFGDENTWKPEGKLEYKVDEGIGQASIKDTGTRASIINMSNLAPFMINIMKEQRSESARFFGRMCEAFLERRLPADVVAKIREKLWNDGQCENLFESVKNLGLNKQAKNKFNDVDAVDNVSQIQFEDKEVERICHEHGVYFIQDAAEVTKISSWFTENDNIKTFDEFKYFTGIETIEYKAFSFCTSLQSITIPNSVSSIEESAFHYCPSLQSITIPDSVTSIEYGAFYRCTSLQSVVIPNSVTIIKERAFMNCESLQSINIPNSVTSIEESTFIECKALKTINIPNSVTRIGGYAFMGCTDLQSVTIPNSVTSIGIRAFGECKSLQSINIPDSVTIIGYSAFKDCSSLRSINIPNSVTRIGFGSFYKCESLHSIYISKNFCPVYSQIKEEYPAIQLIEPKVNESSNLGLNSKAKKKHDELDAIDNINDYVDLGLPSGTLWCRYNYGAGEESIPGKYINFNDAIKLDLSPGILPTKEDFKELCTNCYHRWTSIDGKNGQLFTSKTNGESVFFPADGFEDKIFYNTCGFYWSSSLFRYSSNERAIALYISKNHIDPQYDYSRTIPFSIKTVVKKTNEDFSLGLNKRAKNQFNNTSDNSIEDIGGKDLDIDEFKQYFYDEFFKLKYFNNIKIGHEVQIGDKHHSFIFCYPKNEYKIPDVICRICHETKKFRVMISYYSNTDTDSKEYVFGAETNDNNEYFFDQKEKADLTIANILLAKEFTIKSIEEIISKNPLDESMNLGLNKRAKNIHSEKSEEEVVEELGNIHFESPEIERVCHEHGVYTREDAANVDEFTAWSIFVDIKRHIHYKFHEFKYFTGLEKVGSFFSYTKLEEITLPPTARSIGSHTFRGTLLKSIVIPEGVDEIGDQAFEDCKDLEEIWIPNSLRNFKLNPFSGCFRLKNVYVKKDCPDVIIERITKHLPISFIPAKVIKVDEYPNINESINLGLNKQAKKIHDNTNAIDLVANITFEDPEVEHICHEHGVYTYDDARKVTSIKWFKDNINIKTFNEFKYFTGLKSVEEWTFNWCKYLQFINIPDSVTSIGYDAFSNCESLQSINIPDGVTSIGDNAFHCCYSLESVIIPNSVTSIGEDAFAFCESLKSIIIPNSVTSIGKYTFVECKNLQSIVISKKCPVYDVIKKEYPNIQLIDPNEVNESTNLGLNKKAKQKFDDIDAVDNISDYVDLGLPSGILWCKKNIGANTEEDFGDLLNYQDAVVRSINLSMTLPRIEDFDELNRYCSIEWIDTTDSNGDVLQGMQLTSEVNGNKIFFPAAGHLYSNRVKHLNLNLKGYYWTSEEADAKMEGNYYWSCIFSGKYLSRWKMYDIERFHGWIYNEFDKMSVRNILRKRKQRT